ncbi:MAG: hypothetical protein PHQ52_02645 [Candidatus Omnitrophica bacterium]|nr:hypothetical protein [Candidatus Omnitrophota bacterium]
MKKYIKPKIKAVELLTEQAVLEVCQVGGGWFGNTYNAYCEAYHSVSDGWPNSCTFSVRGVAKGFNWAEMSPGESHPS